MRGLGGVQGPNTGLSAEQAIQNLSDSFYTLFREEYQRPIANLFEPEPREESRGDDMDSGLIVRRSVRFEIVMPARVRVAPHHAEILNFTKGVCDDDRWIDVDVIDFAAGGLGFIIDVFLPRNVDLEIEVFDFHDKSNPPLLSCTLRVQRVLMTDRRPAYQIGCSFTDQDEESKAQVEALIEKLSGISEDAGTGADHA
ncbi:MAG TPA: hypothetical protein DF699_14135 [Phycisphaerales bacterium]|nr:hypothetical protein [Phycisphaerales bacterium]